MESRENLVVFDHVELSSRAGIILEDIHFSLRSGEFVTLIGPNGAGKTTLLKLLIGLIQPTSGRILRRPHLKIGYMPQKVTIDRTLPMTVARFFKLYSLAETASHDHILKSVSVTHLLNTDVNALSGGELQRVLLARALLTQPDLLILDEPVQWIDFLGQHQLYQLIMDYSKAHMCAVLMVSHDLHLVLKGNDRVVCLNRHICCEGTPDQVQSSSSYHALFRSASDLTTYTHHHDHTHTPSGEACP